MNFDDNAADDRGYVRVYRKILESAVFASAALLKAFIWCLAKATHKPFSVTAKTGRGVTIVSLLPGQFITGRKVAAAELGVPPSTAHDLLQRLAQLECIRIQPDTHYSIVTVLNWRTYQCSDGEIQQATQQPSDNQATTIQQPTDTYKNNKHNKNKRAPAANSADFQAWYASYPRKAKPRDAERAYHSAVERIAAHRATTPTEAASWLLGITETFAVSIAGQVSTDGDFRPHPASWLNAGRYDEDPETWNVKRGGATAMPIVCQAPSDEDLQNHRAGGVPV